MDQQKSIGYDKRQTRIAYVNNTFHQPNVHCNN